MTTEYSIWKQNKSKRRPNHCCAIKVFNALTTAWKEMNKGVCVYNMYSNENGNITSYRIAECKGYGANGGKFCKNHMNTKNIISIDEVDTFFEKNKELTDDQNFEPIIPKINSERTFTIIKSKNDPCFNKMGIQGNTKKIDSNTYTFDSKLNPFLVLLNLRDPRLIEEATLFIIELLQKNAKFTKKDETYQEKVEVSRQSTSNKLLEDIKKLQVITDEKNLTKDSDDDDNDDESVMSDISNTDGIIDNIQDLTIKEDVHVSDSEVSIEESDDDDDELSCISIYTTKNKKLYLEPHSKQVIEPEGDNEGEAIGHLVETSKKYSTINQDNKYYTVVSNIYCNEKEEDYYYDVLNNNLFNKEYEKIGKVVKNKNSNEYTFKFK